MGLSAFV